MQQLVAVLFLWCAAAAPALAQQRIHIASDAPYVHAASGMTFPTNVGDYRRAETLTRFVADGSDESVSYRLTTAHGFVQATVYVYPSPAMGVDLAAARSDQCAAHFASVSAEITGVHPNTEVLYSGPAQLDQAGRLRDGYALALTVSSPSGFGERHPPLRSEAHVFCYVGGRWTVKYRFTYASDLAPVADVAGFMRGLAWTIPEAPS